MIKVKYIYFLYNFYIIKIRQVQQIDVYINAFNILRLIDNQITYLKLEENYL